MRVKIEKDKPAGIEQSRSAGKKAHEFTVSFESLLGVGDSALWGVQKGVGAWMSLATREDGKKSTDDIKPSLWSRDQNIAEKDPKSWGGLGGHQQKKKTGYQQEGSRRGLKGSVAREETRFLNVRRDQGRDLGRKREISLERIKHNT